MSLEKLKAEILEDDEIDAGEVEQIKSKLYEDGSIDEDEANFLFDLNDELTAGSVRLATDADWSSLFVTALTDFVLADEESPGHIDAKEADYLIEKIGSDGQIDGSELALLVNIAASAQGESPDNLNQFTLAAVKAAVLADGVVDADEVEMMQKVVYGVGGAGGSGVDRAEADMIFDINDATTNNSGHHGSWQEFFVEAIAKHVLEDDESPNEIDDDESAWLIGRIEGDGEYDANERALLAHIGARATKLTEQMRSFINR